jgi:hypothetical protein
VEAVVKLRLCLVGFLVLDLLLLSGCGGGGGSVSTGAVEGYVFVNTSKSLDLGRQSTPPEGFEGVNGATVTVGSSQTKTRNDSRGNPGYFFLAGIPVGSHTLTVTLSGRNPVSTEVTITAGQTTKVGDVLVGGKYWTFMVYLDADNDLEEDGILNMNQMEMVGSDANINIVVQIDRAKGYDTSNGDWTTTRRYYVTHDDDPLTIKSDLIQDLGELDMADPANLHDFVQWATQNYPASHYCLVIWNHGSGWVPRGGSNATRAVVYDDTTGTIMSMPELREALTGFHLDMVAFDACYMAMLEVSYEIAGACDYVVASEESPPSSGYPYDDILGALAHDPSMTPLGFGRLIAEDYVAAYSSVNESVIATGKLEALAGAVDDLAQAIVADKEHSQARYQWARDHCQACEGMLYYKDLRDFCSMLLSPAANPDQGIPDPFANKTVVQSAIGALDASVAYYAYKGSSLEDSHGLSIYIPGRTGEYFLGYTDLRFTQNYPNWWELIRP